MRPGLFRPRSDAPISATSPTITPPPAASASAPSLREAHRRRIFTSMQEVKARRRGTSRVSSKNQVTIPTDALRAAGIEVGERLVAHADGPGRVVFEREVDVLAEFSGVLTGAFAPDELAGLRNEWD